MNENKDPVTCSQCDTVNPWMNEQCRSCGAPFPENIKRVIEPPVPAENDESTGTPESPSTSPADSSAPVRPVTSITGLPLKAKWNILWICIGFAAYILVVYLGEVAIARWVIAPEPRLKEIVEKAQSEASTISEAESQELRSLLVGHVGFITLVFILLFAAPFLISAAVGYATQGLKEGAVSISLAIFILCLLEQQIIVGLVVGMVYAGLGLVGALSGNWLRQKTHSG